MKKASELFNIASSKEKEITVPLVMMIHEPFELAVQAALEGKFSVLMDLGPSLKDSEIIGILKSWGYTILVVKEGVQPRILVSWVTIKHNKISLV
jgi:hypothetical protein